MLDTLAAWHEILKNRDTNKLGNLLADNAVFHSPVVHAPIHGKAIVLKYLSAALQVFGNETFQYVREIKGESEAVLEFVVEIDGLAVNGADMIKWNDNGRIVDFKVMIRPLSAINLIHRKMAEMLQKSIINQ